jgi:hypothetical protein
MLPVMNVVDRVHLGLQHGFAAIETGPQGRINDGILNWIPESRRADERVLLSMHTDADVIADA